MGRSSIEEPTADCVRANVLPRCISPTTLPLELSQTQTDSQQKPHSRQRKSSRVQLRFAHSARNYLLNGKKLTGRRIYRTLILKNNVIIRIPPKINWIMEILNRELALMGQEVDGALFDLRRSHNRATHAFFTPRLAPAYEMLIELIQIVLPSTTQYALARHIFIQLLTHWMFVCHMHLIRGWLICQPKRRGLLKAHDSVLPLEQLLIRRYHLAKLLRRPTDTFEIVDDGELQVLYDLVGLKVVQACNPVVAKNMYGLLVKLLDRRKLGNRLINSTVLNLVVLMEAEWNAAKRSIADLKKYISMILSGSSESVGWQSHKPTPTGSVYDQPLQFASASAGLMSLICLLFLLVTLTHLFGRTDSSIFGARLAITHSDPLSSSIHRVLTTYCCLAPICVYLNLELRLWFTNILINKTNVIHWFLSFRHLSKTSESQSSIPLASRIQLHELNFEIHWSWKTVEHFEYRLRSVCHQLHHELAHWDIPVPVEYA